jgi:hypothetical protein
MKEEEIYLRTDERMEAFKALIKTIQFLDESNLDIYNWKWFIISLHNTLQAFMVVALKGSNSLSVMKPEHAKKWLNAYETGNQFPTVKLDYFTELFNKIKSNEMSLFTHSKVFTSTDYIDVSVRELNELRNKFIHYMPMGWSLNITGLPALGLDVVTILKFLVSESGNIYFYEDGITEQTEQLLEELSYKLNLMKRKYVV